jgi:alkanesulfonate monooxygenase SsuD/methylene tetrahydromethanopterin reductase-like flavin-dependent oxidoreductase (luciferase family)
VLPGPSDAWTLAGLARETSRIRLGTLMTAATFRHPGPLAISVVTVDRMRSGRVAFGFGTRWFERGLRGAAVGETFSFDGTYYRLKAPALPKPHSGRPPIVIGGGGPWRTPRLAARFADEFNVGFRTVSESQEAFDRVRAACAAEGRPSELVYSALQVVCCGRNDASSRAGPQPSDATSPNCAATGSPVHPPRPWTRSANLVATA